VSTTIGMIFRWYYDNLAFLEKIKILPKGAEYNITSNKYRCVATVAYIILAIKGYFKAARECSEKKVRVRYSSPLFQLLALSPVCATHAFCLSSRVGFVSPTVCFF
jgi:hypothetical protein